MVDSEDVHIGPDAAGRDVTGAGTVHADASTRRIGALDGLRAFAAAAVVWHHCVDETTGYFGRGVGVIAFFAISGFLITRLLFRDQARLGQVAIGAFWLRRALRIFPLYFAVIGLYAVLVARLEAGTAAGAAFWQSLPYYMTFTTNWFVDRSPGERVIFYFAWSLAVQEQFYLLWPAIVGHVRRRRAVLFPLAFLFAHETAVWLASVGLLRHGLSVRIFTGLDTPIFLGVLAAFALDHPRSAEMARRACGRRWSVPLGVTLTLLPAWVPGVPQDVLALNVTYLIVACALAPAGSVGILENPVVRHVGRVSYGIYLLHMLALNAMRHLLPGRRPFLLFAGGFPLAVLAASASYRWFEQPILRLGQRLSGAARALPPAPLPAIRTAS